MFLENYEINCRTIAIIPINKEQSKIIEEEKELVVNQPVFEIIKYSCIYFGCSYEGRFEGTKNLIGVSHKAPIVIEDSKELIFFPTKSPRNTSCSWINYKKLTSYFSRNKKTFLTMNNGYNLELNVSYGIIDNQILRSSYLESIIRQRKSL